MKAMAQISYNTNIKDKLVIGRFKNAKAFNAVTENKITPIY